MTAFRVERWEPGSPAPNLWKSLAGAVCRKAGDKRRRIAVDDSKKLKLANPGAPDPASPPYAAAPKAGRHPLTHLERGVLAFLSACASPGANDGTPCPDNDLALFAALGVEPEGHEWYGGAPLPVPCAHTAPEVVLAANALRRATTGAGVTPLGLWCQSVGETAFNALVVKTGTKAAATGVAIAAHLRRAWREWAAVADASPTPGGPRIVCDRQGGRTDYGVYLQKCVPGAAVEEEEQSPLRSRYRLRGVGDDGRPREMTVLFMPEAESAHLPVALASMTAKLVRELMMARFNRHWCALCPELKPTAGYTQDARRWLRDAQAAGILDESQRMEMVRIA